MVGCLFQNCWLKNFVVWISRIDLNWLELTWLWWKSAQIVPHSTPSSIKPTWHNILSAWSSLHCSSWSFSNHSHISFDQTHWACCSKVARACIQVWFAGDCYMLNWIEQSLMMAVQKSSVVWWVIQNCYHAVLFTLVQCNKEVALTPCYSTCPVGVVKWVWLQLLKVDSIA